MGISVLQFCSKTEVPHSMLLLPEKNLGLFGNKSPLLQSLLNFSLLMIVLWLGFKKATPFKTVTKQQLRE